MTATNDIEKTGAAGAPEKNVPEKNGKAVKVHSEDTAAPAQGKHEASTPAGVERTRSGRVYSPAVDIYETPDSIVLVADMPGVQQDGLDVTLEKNVLTVYGHVEPQQPAGHQLLYSEYRIGDFQRSFQISNQIDWEKISGTVKNGVLRLTLPKAGPAQTRKISITSD